MAALHALNNGMSLRKAAQAFGIAKSTLQRLKCQYRVDAIIQENDLKEQSITYEEFESKDFYNCQ